MSGKRSNEEDRGISQGWEALMQHNWDHTESNLHMRSRFLEIILASGIAITLIFAGIRNLWGSPDPTGVLLTLSICGLLSINFILNRLGRFYTAAWLTLLITSGGIFTISAVIPYPNNLLTLNFLMLPLIVSSILLSHRATLLLLAISIIGTLLMPYVSDEITWDGIIASPIRFIVTLSFVLLATLYYQQQLTQHNRERIRASEQRFRVISELTSDYAYSITVTPEKDLYVDWITEAFYRITGFTLDELNLSQGLYDLVIPEDRPLIQQRFQGCLRGEAGKLEYRIAHKQTGQIRWLREFSRPIWDDTANRTTQIIGAGEDITARKKAENAIRQQEAEKAALLNAIPDTMLRFDSEGNYLDVHANGQQDGYIATSPKELIGQNITDLLPQELAQLTLQNIQKTLETQQPTQYEFEIEAHSSKQYLETRMVPIEEDEVLAIVRNITERKTTENQLQDRMNELRILQRLDKELGYTLQFQYVLDIALDVASRRTNASASAIAWVDPQTQILKRYAYLGAPQHLPEAVPLSALKHTEAHQCLAWVLESNQQYSERDEKGIPHLLVFPLSVRGEPKGVLLLESIRTDTFSTADQNYLVQLANRTAIALNNVQNYTQIQQHAYHMDLLYQLSHGLATSLNRQQVMENSTRAITTLLNCSHAVFCDYHNQNHTMTIQAAFNTTPAPLPLNQEYADLPFKEADLLNDSVLGFVKDTPDILPAADELLQQWDAQSMLVIGLEKDEKLQGILVACEKRRRRIFTEEESALALNLALQTTIALERAKIIQNLKNLEQVKTEMIRVASHDLRNPLSQIHGYLELIEDDIGDNGSQLLQDYMDSIKKGIYKMRQLLEDILSLERVESFGPADWGLIQFDQLATAVILNFEKQAKLKEQTYSYTIQPDLPSAIGNDMQLEQAISNLISNAIKYTHPQGDIQITLEEDEGRIAFRVKDNGYGIPKNRQGRLFERFYRARTPGTEQIGGTGLGLSLVKTIIERHGGEVFFESEMHKGSTFGFWLPPSTEV